MKRKAILEEMICPQLLYCTYFSQGMTMQVGTAIKKRTVFDYELEIITDSDTGWMWIDERKVVVKKGDILFRKPGQITQGIMCYNSIWTCFQFTGSKRMSTYDLEESKTFGESVYHPILDNMKEKYESRHSERYYYLFKEILDHHIHQQEGSILYIKSLLLQLIYSLYQENKQNERKWHSHNQRIAATIKYIKENLEKDLSLHQLSKLSLLSPTYFHQQFTQVTGLTPNRFVTNERITKAKDLLVYTTQTIDEVGQRSGFKSTSYFCASFKKLVGMTPTEFRKKYTQFH